MLEPSDDVLTAEERPYTMNDETHPSCHADVSCEI